MNSEIASVHWNFERDALTRLCERGLAFRDVTLASVAVVQDRFVRDSPKLSEFAARGRRAPRPVLVTHDGAG